VINVNQFGNQKIVVTTARNFYDYKVRNEFLITKLDLNTALPDTTYLHIPTVTMVQDIKHCDGVDMDSNYFYSRDVAQGFHVFKSNKSFKVKSCKNTTANIVMNDIVIEKKAFSFNTIDQNTAKLKDKILNFDTLQLVKYDICSDCGCPSKLTIEHCGNRKYISPWSGIVFEFNTPTLDTFSVVDGCHYFAETTIKPTKQKEVQIDRALCKSIPFVKIGFKTYTKSGIYQDTLKTDTGCDSILTINIKDISVSLGEDKEILEGDKVKLEAKTNDGQVIDNYTWLPQGTTSCDTCQFINVMPNKNQWYSVKVVKDGCVVRDSILIKVLNQKLVYIPNVFSPNGDKINDLFRPYCAEGVVEIEYFQVFDRWGTLIYDVTNYNATDSTIGWDGTYKNIPANRDVYTYAVKVRLRNGQTQKYLGDVMLLRE
jgi:gliding motility-associated-like protein